MENSPPSSWYEPPEPKHDPECEGCSECHSDHLNWNIVVQMAEEGFTCCVEQIEKWIARGEFCVRCNMHATTDENELCSLCVSNKFGVVVGT